MSELHIDFETRSNIDLRRSGVYRYAEDHTTSVICAAYAFGDEDPALWKMGEPCPKELIEHVMSGAPIYAHNAQFERVLWHYCLESWPRPDIKQWRCTAAMAAVLSLPRDLSRAAKSQGLKELKDDTGRRIMLKMCQPRAVHGTTIIWNEQPDDLEKLYEYCKQDVRVERELAKHLRPLSDREQKIWFIDQKINSRGVMVDTPGVLNAKVIVAAATRELNIEIAQLTNGYVTGLTQAEAIKQWCASKGVVLESVDKYALIDVLKDDSLDPDVRRVLAIRQEGGKSSTAKLRAYQERASLDGRMRDNLMYYGANTGRWAGRGAQLQNLPRSKIQDIPDAIELMKFRDPSRLSVFYGPPLETVSDCLRGFVVAPPGKKLIAADFSNIEGRVLAWLAGHHELVEAFRSGAKIYENMAAAIYGIAVEAVKKGSKERHLGKSAVLGGGYGMGPKRFQNQCAREGVTIDDDLAQRTIDVYRSVNQPIVQYWYALERAALEAIKNPGKKKVVEGTGGTPREVSFASSKTFLWCKLPSGRLLSYPDPQVQMLDAPWGEKKATVTYMTVDNLTNQWMRDKTYGGKLAENVTSGLARDIMAEAMMALEAEGYPIVLTVHDEIVCEVKEDFGSVKEMEAIMCEVPDFCPGLPIAAEGFEAKRYRK